MGFGSPAKMRQGLIATRECSVCSIGTLTLDSYSRGCDYLSPLVDLSQGIELNGYPILSYPADTTRQILEGIQCDSFPVQMRHGTPLPMDVFKKLGEVGINATEGGPISYCMPYGRVALKDCTKAWFNASRYMQGEFEQPHLETFGGCLMGQLCPPSLLVATSILEALFFASAGIRSVSLSYCQGTSLQQDYAALTVLRNQALRYLNRLDWHVVVYTYMGMYPKSASGAEMLLRDSAGLAQTAGCERLIVKTRSERYRIPSIEDNLQALITADQAAAAITNHPGYTVRTAELQSEIEEEVQSIIESVLNLSSDLQAAIVGSFERGILDIPFCLHPDNAQQARGLVDENGQLKWAKTGNLPFKHDPSQKQKPLTPELLLWQLEYVANKYDNLAANQKGIRPK